MLDNIEDITTVQSGLVRRLAKEMQDYTIGPTPGITCYIPDYNDLHHWKGCILGP